MQLDYHAPPVNGSSGRLEQIFLNLVVNASEAMQGHGTLQILVQPVGALPESLVLRPRDAARHLALKVIDSGPGIEAEILPRIFEPFFTTKNRGATRGTGLGLSMVYTMAEQEGWGISVETQAGRGTTFCILVPVAAG